ncbi:hypothetical protein ACFL6R_05040 [Gemmatimonadota bacterium]
MAKKEAEKREEAATEEAVEKDICFVVMPFDDPFEKYQRIYRLAIEAANLKPVRADDIFRPGFIMKDVWAYVREASVLLAELTGRNANVFYELGLAHAIAKPVVLVTKDISDVPFDIGGLRAIEYQPEDPEWGDHLKVKITEALLGAIQKPLEAVPPIFIDEAAPERPAEDAVHLELRKMSARIEQLERITAWSRTQNSDNDIIVYSKSGARIQLSTADIFAFAGMINEMQTEGFSKESIRANIAQRLQLYLDDSAVDLIYTLAEAEM